MITILDQIESAHIFSISTNEQGFEILEECDLYYGFKLSRFQLFILGFEIIFVALGLMKGAK